VEDLTHQRDHAHKIGVAREQRIIHLELENVDLREQHRQLRAQVHPNAGQAAEDEEVNWGYVSDGLEDY
jgi:hypothetical protein